MTRFASQSVFGLLPASWHAISMDDYFPVPSSIAEAVHWVGPELHVSTDGYSLYLRGGPSLDLAHTAPDAVCVSEDEVPTLLAGVKNVAVSFDSALMFSSLIQLPWSSKKKSEKILSIRREQTLPVQQDSYVHGWFETKPTSLGEKRVVNQIVLKRELIERVVRKIKNSRSNCEMLFVRDAHAKSLPVAWNASGTSYRAVEIDRWIRYFWLGLAGLVVGVSSVGGALIYQQGLKSQIVESQLARLQPEATRLSKMRQTQSQLQDELESLAVAVSPKHMVSQKIEKLAELLEDDVALTGLSFDQGSLTIEGTAQAPEKLIALLDNGDDFTGVSFSAPVFRNPDESKSRFAIKLRMSGDVK